MTGPPEKPGERGRSGQGWLESPNSPAAASGARSWGMGGSCSSGASAGGTLPGEQGQRSATAAGLEGDPCRGWRMAGNRSRGLRSQRRERHLQCRTRVSPQQPEQGRPLCEGRRPAGEGRVQGHLEPNGPVTHRGKGGGSSTAGVGELRLGRGNADSPRRAWPS